MHEPPSTPTCASCGYDLTGTPVVNHQFTCPECGGHDVRIPKWYDPRLRPARAALYLPVAAVAVVPLVLLACLVTGRWGSWLSLALLASPPLLLMGTLLAAWRPNRVVGLTMIAVADALAGLLAAAALLALRIPEPFNMLALVPLGIAYYALPLPLGVVLTRAMLDTSI